MVQKNASRPAEDIEVEYIRRKGELKMKELDIVKLIQDYENIPAGTIGTIVCEYDGKAFEIEFFDTNGDTLDVITTPAELLILVEEY